MSNDNKKDKRLTILLTPATHKEWSKFIDAHKDEYSNLSEFVRKTIKYYIKNHEILSKLKDFQALSHDLKEPLTAIKGFTQLINKQSDKLDNKVVQKLNKIMAKVQTLEDKINQLFLKEETLVSKEGYDVLVVEDDPATIEVLEEFFEMEGFIIKGVNNGKKALKELENKTPRLILLDILLPDMDGYVICEKIKEKKELKDVPVFYITAVPEEIVKNKVKETKATGYFLKPFDLPDLDKLVDLLKKK